MIYANPYLKRFGKLTVFSQSCLIVAAAVIGAETLTFVFYSIFFADRLLLDLALTAVIVIIVGFPLAYFFIGQQVKLSVMAARLDQAARTDGLTGLTNRKTFFEEAAGAICMAGPPTGALLFIDVDHFKSVNDTFGHAVGDAVLRDLGAVIRSSVREKDLAARLGGEEFAVFLHDADRDEAIRVAERIRMNVRHLTPGVGVEDRTITVSIGVCVREFGQNLEHILLEADHNLYAAKKQGRDRVVDKRASRSVAKIGASSTALRKLHGKPSRTSDPKLLHATCL